ncbi:glutathione peroxidase [Cellulosilyticum sp. I15G10I2]|uniref:glutathione peroxidase n=1 Tax=Cellulosilyticum sp. I15G10I2 TaxID=1892843 RepID=UPI00085C0DBD|nr:glutathione peroxidase [Cellulosilyticum sp. I15G10I2]
MTIYDFSANSIGGQPIDFDKYKGKVIIIANTASKCGFTPQYEDLQKLYEEYKDQGLEILGFPCNQFEGQEPGANEEVQAFCSLNYGVSFQLFEKVDVREENAHPLFKYLTQNAPFKGFDLNHPIGKILQSLLQEKHPEFLIDDSIKWNFTKFLIDQNGNIVKRYEPTTSPLDMEDDIKKLLS